MSVIDMFTFFVYGLLVSFFWVGYGLGTTEMQFLCTSEELEKKNNNLNR